MSQKQSQKRSRSQKQAKPKSQKLDDITCDISQEVIKNLMQMPLEEIEKKVAEKRALLENMNGVMEGKMEILKTLVEQKAQFDVEIKMNKRLHAKQKRIVTEGTEEFKQAQAMYNELVDEFGRNQAIVAAKRNDYQQMAKNFVGMSKDIETECEGFTQILSDKQAESENADQIIKQMEQVLADKRAQNVQKRIALQEKQKALLDLKAKVASVDMNALTVRLEDTKLKNEEMSQQILAIREEMHTVKAAQSELAMNKIIAEADLEEVEQEVAQKTALLEDRESNLGLQMSFLQKTATVKMKERIDRILHGNRNLAEQVQDMPEKIAANKALMIELQGELQNAITALQNAHQQKDQKLNENMQLAKSIADAPNIIIDRQQEINDLKDKIEAVKQETNAIHKETKETAKKYSKKIKKEQRRQAFLGVLEESSMSPNSETESFDLNISSSMASDIVVNLPKVDLNETDNACAQLEQMKGN